MRKALDASWETRDKNPFRVQKISLSCSWKKSCFSSGAEQKKERVGLRKKIRDIEKSEAEVPRKWRSSTNAYASHCQVLMDLAARFSLAALNLAGHGVLLKWGSSSFQISVRKGQSAKTASTLLNLTSLPMLGTLILYSTKQTSTKGMPIPPMVMFTPLGSAGFW